MAGVQLDGGEDSLPGGGSGGHGDGTSSVGESGGTNDLRGGMGDVSHNGGGLGSGDGSNEAMGVGSGKGVTSIGTGKGKASVGSGKGKASVGSGKGEASVGSGKGKTSVGSEASQGQTSSDNLGRPPLPLSRGGGSNSSLLGGVGRSKGSLGINDLLGVTNLNSLEDGGGGLDSLEDRCNKASGSGNRQVGALDTESVHVIGDVVDSLDKTVGINVLVGAGGHSVGVTGLSPGRWAAGVAEGELAELILSVELVGGGGGGDC